MRAFSPSSGFCGRWTSNKHGELMGLLRKPTFRRLACYEPVMRTSTMPSVSGEIAPCDGSLPESR